MPRIALPQQRVVVVEVELAALDRERQRPPSGGGRSAPAAASRSTARAIAARSRGARVVAAVLEAVGRARSACRAGPSPRARRVHQRDEARHACRAARWASAIAASLPDGSSSPWSIVSTPIRLPAREQADARALVVQRLARDRAPARPRGTRSATSSAVIIFVSDAIGSTRVGSRRHSTRPVSRSNSSPARGGCLKRSAHRVARRRRAAPRAARARCRRRPAARCRRRRRARRRRRRGARGRARPSPALGDEEHDARPRRRARPAPPARARPAPPPAPPTALEQRVRHQLAAVASSAAP